MESMKHTIAELSEHFNSKMAEFQKQLQTSSASVTSPASTIATQFSTFRSFVLTALEGLQKQLDVLSRKQDEFEMRSRKKILLIHGVQESKNEKMSQVVTKIISENLDIPLKEDDISHCHRLGHSRSDKPRAVLVKFKDFSLRNKIWYSKSGLKNSGITLSEFLTKERHSTFVAARQRLGVSKCWTKDGYVVVVGADGSQSRILTVGELNAISPLPHDAPLSTSSAPLVSSGPSNTGKVSNIRTKRAIKK
ncbi:unnamed protein product, partial [Brenthis ino]